MTEAGGPATGRRLRRMAAVVPALMILLATRDAVIAQRTAWTFEELQAGRPPAGFLFASSPKDQSGQWSVVRDGTNSVLAQLRQGQSGVQLAVVDGPSFADLVLSVRVRLLEGARLAGVVWHYRDADNYYLARLDLREQDVRIYRVVAGQRTRLEEEDGLELPADSWNVLKVEHRGTRMRLLINGVPVADARDRTGQEAGAVGLWTSDSVAWFDDLSIQPAPVERKRGDRQD
jgi:3-keto-disaccharide hydrolase